MPKASRAATLAQYQALLVGMPKYCPAAVFNIGGESYTTPQVVTLINSLLDVSSAVAPAKATATAAIKAVETTEASDGKTVRAIREVVALMFVNDPTTLAALAIPPRKTPTPLSTQARAAAEAKAKATREARGTTSKKQKALITGNVTGATIVPVMAPGSTPVATPVVSTQATTTASGLTPAATVPPAATGSGSSTPHS